MNTICSAPPTANGAQIRVGDAQVGTARGAAIDPGAFVEIPRCSFGQGGYDLSQVYVWGAGGADKVSVTFGA